MCVLLPNLKDYKTTLPIGSSNRQKEGSRGKKYKNLDVERKDCEDLQFLMTSFYFGVLNC